jgi:HPr kinase/phosphorylase
MADMHHNMHGTAISINGHGVLILGESGTGKTDLALRLIDRGALLICDDRVIVDSSSSIPMLRQAPNIKGIIEVRGIGLITLDTKEYAPLRLCVLLNVVPDRLPDEHAAHECAGFSIPKIALDAFTASAPIKLEIALKSVVDRAIEPVALSQKKAGLK